jgi:nucleotide-binding universal stress UspA family protein
MNDEGPVIVPLDGSTLAESALPVAVELARLARAELLLVHVHVPLTPEPIYVEGLPVLDEHLRPLRRQHEQAYLDRHLKAVGGAVRAASLILLGSPAQAIAAHAQAIGASLVVTTTHGRGGLERAWLGSVADDLIRVSPVPLLLIRPGTAVSAPFRRLLVPLDGSPLGETILPSATRLAGIDPEAEIVLLRIVQPVTSALWVADPAVLPAATMAELSRQAQADAEGYLAEVLRRLGPPRPRARARVATADGVAAAILEVAREEGADLVALATHGRSGFVRLALGSVADKVLRGSPLPVLLHRPPVRG